MKLLKKEFLDFEGYVYNIEVEDNHNYFAEDILVSNCYLSCNEHGKHADLNNPILDSLHSGMELAINLNDLSHPDLENFLIRMKDQGIIVNATINQKHLKDNIDTLKNWQDRQLIWGIGISLINSEDPIIWENGLKNTVIHVIDGCFSKKDIDNLSNHNLKLLILGFKHKGRGVDYYNDYKEKIDNNIKYLNEHIMEYSNKFNTIAFDNLSANNLNLKEKIDPAIWKTHYMGNEGEFTMYIDLVHNRYAISSMETEYFNITHDDTIDTIFKHIRKMGNYEKDINN